jgi:hypothetical protein
MNKKIHIISMAILIVIIGGGTFYGGMIFGKNQKPNFQANGIGNFQGQRTGLTGQNRQVGAGFINGDVVLKDNTSITVKSKDGSSKIVFYSDTTEFSKFAQGSINDVKTGDSVMINGKTNSDGSITAQTIQIRPTMPTGQENPSLPAQ